MTKRPRTLMENSARGRKMFSQPNACLTSVRSQVDLKNPYEKQGAAAAAHDCNISHGDMGGGERRTPGICWSSSLTYLAKFKAKKRPCLQQMWQIFEE